MIIPHCNKCGELMKGQNEFCKEDNFVFWSWFCSNCEPFAYKRSIGFGAVFRGK